MLKDRLVAPTYSEIVTTLTTLNVRRIDSALFETTVRDARTLLPELGEDEQKVIIDHIFRLQVEILSSTNSFAKLDEYLTKLVIYLASNDQCIGYSEFTVIVRATMEIYSNTCELVLEENDEAERKSKLESVLMKLKTLWVDEKLLNTTDKLIIIMEKQTGTRFAIIDSNGNDLLDFIN